MTWVVRIRGEIDDEIEVERDDLPADASDEDVIDAAHEIWSFVEGSSWSGEVIERPEPEDETDDE